MPKCKTNNYANVSVLEFILKSIKHFLILGLLRSIRFSAEKYELVASVKRRIASERASERNAFHVSTFPRARPIYKMLGGVGLVAYRLERARATTIISQLRQLQ
jgi:hypothetical protein